MLTQPIIVIPTSRHEEIVSNYFMCPNKKNMIKIIGEKVDIEDLEKKCEEQNIIFERKKFCKENKNKCSFCENNESFCLVMGSLIAAIVIILIVFLLACLF